MNIDDLKRNRFVVVKDSYPHGTYVAKIVGKSKDIADHVTLCLTPNKADKKIVFPEDVLHQFSKKESDNYNLTHRWKNKEFKGIIRKNDFFQAKKD